MSLINRDDAIAIAKYSKDPAEGIKNLPAVDAVEVVRCRDCKWGVKDDGLYQCTIDAEYDEELRGYIGFVDWHKAEHFCSYGERKDGE